VKGSLPLSISKFFNLDLLRALRFVRVNNISLIHLHGFEGLLWGHALAVMARVPVVFTPHTIDMKNRFFFFFFKIAWRICSLYASMLITVSPEDAHTTRRRRIIRGDKLRTVLLGVSRARLDGATAQRPKIDGIDTKKWVVQVGHLSYQKNPFCFVRAAARLAPKNPDLAFMFIGEGPLRAELVQQIEQCRLTSTVLVLGYRDDALAIMKHAWAIVNTSRWEGMPFTLIDACFLGKAIVASAVNGIKDLIDDGATGLLFTPDSDAELVQRIDILLWHESLRQELGRSAMRSVSDKYTLQAMAQEHIAAYTAVVAPHRAGRT